MEEQTQDTAAAAGVPNTRQWYAIHTYSGYENAVVRNLKQRIESLGMEDKIFEVVVPKEKKIKMKAGKRVELEEEIYPGYVLVNMIYDPDSDRKSTRLNSSHIQKSRMPSSA